MRISNLDEQEMSPNHLKTERFDLLKDDTVCIADYRFGHNRRGKRDVWIERSDKGERFLSQITVEGEALAVRKEIYTGSCYILREKTTGRYHFLDENDCGFWLHSESFSGAEAFCGDESVKIQEWLTAHSN
ncbi:MAG: hypothetical protein WAV47_05775 [Blastocatellia bacterium]